MSGFLLYLFILLRISIPSESSFPSVSDIMIADTMHERQEQLINPMKALDIVQKQYAANFIKIYENTKDYYYKLAEADLYLVYEEETGADKDYLIHLYEFVEDEPETGVGHMVTYGWYTVDRKDGAVTALEYGS